MMKRQTESVNSIFNGRDLFRAVVFLLVMEKSKRGGEEEAPRLSVGTGFVVNAKEGLIVTAAHVVRSPKDADATVYVGVVGEVVRRAEYKYTASPHRYHETLDVCVLKIDTKLGNTENPGAGLSTIHDLSGANQKLVNVEDENLVELLLEEVRRRRPLRL